MIIRYPTGLYLDQLPLKASQSGAFTWIISTQDPLKPAISLQQIPLIKQLQKSPDVQFDSEERRQVYGKLLFTTTSAHTPENLSNNIAFEVGRVLSNTDIALIEASTGVTPDNVEIQHDNNRFDLAAVGLSNDESSYVTTQSRAKLAALRIQFNSVKLELISTQNSIKEYQKLLNEIDDTISVMSLIDNSEEIVEKLTTNRENISSKLEAAQVSETALLEQAETIYDNILKVSVLVR